MLLLTKNMAEFIEEQLKRNNKTNLDLNIHNITKKDIEEASKAMIDRICGGENMVSDGMSIIVDTEDIKKMCNDIGDKIKRFAKEHEELSWCKEDCDRYTFDTQFGMIDVVFNNANKKIKVMLDCHGLSDESFEDLKQNISILKNVIASKE